jgi:hypothetical protein
MLPYMRKEYIMEMLVIAIVGIIISYTIGNTKK